MPASAIVLVVDRWGAGFLGPYGATWLDTPACNRLAAESLLVETCFADAPDLAQACRAFWTGRHAAEPSTLDEARFALPRLSLAAGAAGTLITDDPLVAGHPLALEFDAIEQIRTPSPTEPAEEISQTGLAAIFDAALDFLARQNEPYLLWIHAQGMAGPWDAPYELRAEFADEDDPPPPRIVVPPDFRTPDNFDPDLLLGYLHAYAGQVRLVDLLLGDFLGELAAHPLAGETLLAVTSPRGFPLGEHGRIGPCDAALYGELLQTPLLIRFPGGEGALARTQQLAQTCDLAPTLADACGWLPAEGPFSADWRRRSLLRVVRGEPGVLRDRAIALSADQRAIRTPAWFLRESRSADDSAALGESQRELFVKPDDRWEANEVASRCGEVAALLSAEIDAFAAARQTSASAELPPLAEVLRSIQR